jgi:RibD domain-containing protein
MRKIVVQMMLSLDGHFEGPDHDLSWHLVDEELHAHFNEQLATMSAFVEGRVTYELIEAVWPTADQTLDYPPTMREFAGIWRSVPKIVFFRTLHEVGPNASLRAGGSAGSTWSRPSAGWTWSTSTGSTSPRSSSAAVDEPFETADNPTGLELVEHADTVAALRNYRAARGLRRFYRRMVAFGPPLRAAEAS